MPELRLRVSSKDRRAQSVNNPPYKDCIYEVEQMSAGVGSAGSVSEAQMMPLKGLLVSMVTSHAAQVIEVGTLCCVGCSVTIHGMAPIVAETCMASIPHSQLGPGHARELHHSRLIGRWTEYTDADETQVAMFEAHSDLELFRIRLGKALDYEFHEDYIGGYFSEKGPRDVSSDFAVRLSCCISCLHGRHRGCGI